MTSRLSHGRVGGGAVSGSFTGGFLYRRKLGEGKLPINPREVGAKFTGSSKFFLGLQDLLETFFGLIFP